MDVTSRRHLRLPPRRADRPAWNWSATLPTSLTDGSSSPRPRQSGRGRAPGSVASRHTAYSSAVIGCCAVVAVSGCATAHSPTASSATTSSVSAESLIVGLDDVRRITGTSNLTSVSDSDPNQPSRNTDDPDAPVACRVTWGGQATFASGWKQFRSADYRGSTQPTVGGAPGATGLLDIGQAIATYSDESAAHAAFDRLGPALATCSAQGAKNYVFTVNKQDPSTVALNYPQHDRAKVYRVKSTALIYVGILSLPTQRPDQLARTVLQTITDRIK